MAGYLAGAAGTAALLGAPQAEAAVTAVTFSFGTELNVADGPGHNFVNGGSFGTIYSAISSFYFYFGQFGGGSQVYRTAGFNGRAVFFSGGTIIGGGGNGALGAAFFQEYDPSLDFTSDQLNKNIAFKTSTNNWGWANVDWIEATKTLEINSAYVESIAGNTITVGDVGAVPEPSRALLALAGFGAVTLRRRRKQAA